MSRHSRFSLCGVSLFAGALLVGAAAAGWTDDDHQRAKAAREAGQIVPLETILDRVQAEFQGAPVEVELEDEDGRWVYTVKLLTPAGALVKLEYDAADARLLRVKGRGAESARR